MRTIDFSPLYRSVVGFDRLASLLETAAADAATGYPPYNFERRFQLADYVVVADASLADGLLSISLKRELPEALKPRTIAISTGVQGSLIEGEKAA